MKKRTGIISALLLTIGVLMTGCGNQTSETAGEAAKTAGVSVKEIRIATQPIPQYAPIFVAKKKGWLEEELKKAGVTAKWSSFESGPPMNESFASGGQDIGLLGDTAAIIPRAAGQDTRIIGIASSSPQALAILVRKDSPITSPKDLKGKKVSVVKGSYAHHLLSLVLKNNGLTTDDIKFINMTQGDTATALTTGDIDAGTVWEPVITKLLDNGTARVLADGTGIKNGLLVSVATNKFAAQNPELIKIYLKAYQRGAEYIQANLKEASQLIAEDVKLSPEQLEKVLAKFDFNPAIKPEDIAELKKSEEFMKSAALINNDVDIDTFVDTTYSKAAGIQ
ncbi:aliphatic sulfonates family ABC transporter, periplasmic ligand-binding protein [Syntrophobotulus glycolicus DSM 8271]|uniref:Putative aliphatic sulfonates-binding protein n=1 Tax=Syntrophobotulus glycolicus (strain DSM 8271 / FlGlyR) TaxID=645991 RepID=F0SXL0_SYNGF|nr:aliphatic sulfonate ABC transporter substrate-binding protein [Syntrophobotulus glycolicus]ADY55843.1 aliphatic sulfonates family ABC transporter, periplasmic ligand-binding protein [Syntrophobotulus glycolicus DSM 8271]